MKKKVFNYYTLALILKSLYESCMKAWEQQKNGEKVTACGMSDEDIEELCDRVYEMEIGVPPVSVPGKNKAVPCSEMHIFQ